MATLVPDSQLQKRYAIIVAGGSGLRIGGAIPKQFQLFHGKPLLWYAIQAFAKAGADIEIMLVLPSAHFSFWEDLRAKYSFPPLQLVVGGSSRSQSVSNALAVVPATALVAIHDAVRPYITLSLINASYAAAAASGACVLAVPSKDSIRYRHPDGTSQPLQRANVMLVQTPQTFLAGLLQVAYKLASLDGSFTDDATVAEAAGHKIAIVPGDYANIKITTPEDLLLPAPTIL